MNFFYLRHIHHHDEKNNVECDEDVTALGVFHGKGGKFEETDRSKAIWCGLNQHFTRNTHNLAVFLAKTRSISLM